MKVYASIILGFFGSHFTACDWLSGTSSDSERSYKQAAVGSQTYFRWTSLDGGEAIPLYIEIADAASEVPFGVDPAALQSTVRQAVTAWESATGIRFEPVYALHSASQSFQNGEALIYVRFFADPFAQNRAVTTPMYFGNSLASMTIDFPAPVAWQGGPNSLLMMHEFGHALGLIGGQGATGHSNNGADIMYPQIQPQVSGLSNADVRTMKDLYSEQPLTYRIDAAGSAATSMLPAQPYVAERPEFLRNPWTYLPWSSTRACCGNEHH